MFSVLVCHGPGVVICSVVTVRRLRRERIHDCVPVCLYSTFQFYRLTNFYELFNIYDIQENAQYMSIHLGKGTILHYS